MPNWCEYEMHVRGSKENVEEFKKVLTSKYGENGWTFPRYLSGTDELSSEKEGGTNDDYWGEYKGYCRWSVVTSMLEGKGTYYDDYKDEKDNDGGQITSLEKESQNLNLKIEVYSLEPGMCFMEHYYIENGVVKDAESVHCVSGYSTVEEMLWNKVIESEEEIKDWIFDSKIGYYRQGGMEWNFRI